MSHPTYGIVDAIITPLFAWKLANDMNTRFGHEQPAMMHFIFYLIPILGLLTLWQDFGRIGKALEAKGKPNNATMLFLITIIFAPAGAFLTGNALNELGAIGGAAAAEA